MEWWWSGNEEIVQWWLQAEEMDERERGIRLELDVAEQ